MLAEGGVDGFIIETMTDLREALCAVRAVREASSLPVLASVSLKTVANGGRTIMGDTARDCAAKLAEAGACAVGANCGELDPLEIAQIVAFMREATDVPIIAQPNAGKVQLVDMRPTYGMSPADFAEGLRACAEAGARLVGGCCGTSPAHIKAAVDLLSGREG